MQFDMIYILKENSRQIFFCLQSIVYILANSLLCHMQYHHAMLEWDSVVKISCHAILYAWYTELYTHVPDIYFNWMTDKALVMIGLQ